MKRGLLFLIVFLSTYLVLTAVYGAEAKRLPNYASGVHQSVASDCRALRELNQEHKGRTLSDEEKVVKAQLFTWYKTNCKKASRQ